jgi:hypothetical protein
MPWTKAQEIDERGEGVEEDPPEEDMIEPRGWEVLVEHEEVVAEVQEDLPWTLGRECSSSDMIDDGARSMKDTIASGIETPREVYLLLVSKEAPIKSPDL